jgi:hypothetical protein
MRDPVAWKREMILGFWLQRACNTSSYVLPWKGFLCHVLPQPDHLLTCQPCRHLLPPLLHAAGRLLLLLSSSSCSFVLQANRAAPDLAEAGRTRSRTKGSSGYGRSPNTSTSFGERKEREKTKGHERAVGDAFVLCLV